MTTFDHQAFDARLGEQLRLARKKRGITKSGLAAGLQLPLTARQLEQIERGDASLSAVHLVQIVQRLDLPLALLLGRVLLDARLDESELAEAWQRLDGPARSRLRRLVCHVADGDAIESA
ncbi:helix-turn-helix domain-containing protein [Posidoniimonas corsicana]|nr:helix-turn-helix domain-containing protein [Posidoniimonas corsicana]